MLHPFQCIEACTTSGQLDQLLIACDNELFCVNPETGRILSSWKDEETQAKLQDDYTLVASRNNTADHKPVKASIILLRLSHDQHHLLAVTDTDKTVHVFSLTNGVLAHLNKRPMPKRPSGLAFTADDSTILVADKFGDVYALPLHPEASTSDTSAAPPAATTQPYHPAATDLTVHSAQNLRTLESQKRAAASGHMQRRKEKTTHALVLGHVSMLTDLLTASAPSPSNHPTQTPQPGKRHYILTADRDEHIRVSRAPPQAHIIETYCLGHTQFVAKLCLVREDLLVSGGGDEFLLVWDWVHGRLLSRIDLRGPCGEMRRQERWTGKIAVAGLWSLERAVGGMEGAVGLLCALERVRGLIMFHGRVGGDGWVWDHRIVELEGAPLDVVVYSGGFAVSTDHCIGSADEASPSRVQTFKIAVPEDEHSALEVSEVQTDWTQGDEIGAVGHIADTEAERKRLDALLYKTETLRKHAHHDADAEDV
ncbi:MAG: tRNA (guanine-N(7)-)-methyltransferase non-catalytic subunit trm82 [Chrysothrix sp. TS-e1954]|nr:MAG: tRNA (guanine-N(7)-)-methyltransferase non-catalytic subunit trm82 [Chrysothrix sp. TS-e1954]